MNSVLCLSTFDIVVGVAVVSWAVVVIISTDLALYFRRCAQANARSAVPTASDVRASQKAARSYAWTLASILGIGAAAIIGIVAVGVAIILNALAGLS